MFCGVQSGSSTGFKELCKCNWSNYCLAWMGEGKGCVQGVTECVAMCAKS